MLPRSHPAGSPLRLRALPERNGECRVTRYRWHFSRPAGVDDAVSSPVVCAPLRSQSPCRVSRRRRAEARRGRRDAPTASQMSGQQTAQIPPRRPWNYHGGLAALALKPGRGAHEPDNCRLGLALVPAAAQEIAKSRTLPADMVIHSRRRDVDHFGRRTGRDSDRQLCLLATARHALDTPDVLVESAASSALCVRKLMFAPIGLRTVPVDSGSPM